MKYRWCDTSKSKSINVNQLIQKSVSQKKKKKKPNTKSNWACLHVASGLSQILILFSKIELNVTLFIS